MSARGTEDLFAAWWELYPRKVGKGAARVAFYRALRRVPAERMQAALQGQIEAGVFEVETIYIPHPATWLRQERWDDELQRRRTASAADGIAERWRDACRRGDETAKAMLRSEAKARSIDWARVREALDRLGGEA